MKNSISLYQDTFVLKDGKSHIVYSPFTNLISRVPAFPTKGSSLYQACLNKGFFKPISENVCKRSNWTGFHSLTLLLTRRCNLRCIYCYASPTSHGSSMPLELAIDAVKYFLKQLPDKKIRITFHGGGEPTLEEETIRKVVAFTEKNRDGRPVHYLITTNGTASSKFMTWMMTKKFAISISMDGPSKIQDRNRPLANGNGSSKIVERNVHLLVSQHYPFTIRLTYSPKDDVVTIIKYFAKLGVKNIHLEPLFPHGRFYKVAKFGEKSQYNVYPPVKKELLTKFLQAIDTCKKYGIRIYNGHLIHFTRGIGYFCGAASAHSMLATHDGLLSGCLEVVDRNDKNAETFTLGHYVKEKHRFNLDKSKIKMMRARHADLLPKCKNCFARYVCAGGCAVKAVHVFCNFFEKDLSYCGFTRAIVPILIKKIARDSGV